MTPDPNPVAASSSELPAAPRPKRRWWLWGIAVLVLGVLLLVALAPTLASLPPIKGIVVGKVDAMLNGHVEVGSYSVGWFSPIKASGIKVFDEQNRQIADVPNVRINLTLFQAIRQQFHLGQGSQIDVASFVLNIDEHNETNFQKLLKTEPKTEVKAETKATTQAVVKKESPLPDVSGEITLNFAGTVEGAGVKQPVQVDPSSAVVTITNINQPISNAVKIKYRVGDSAQASTLTTTGTIDAIENNLLNVGHLSAGQKISFGNVNLAGLEPFLKVAGGEGMKTLSVAGLVTGDLNIQAADALPTSAAGTIHVKGFKIGGGPLDQDQFATDTIDIPVNLTSNTVNGQTVYDFKDVGVSMAQANVRVVGQIPEQALLNLKDKKAPGGDGSLTISATVTDLPNLATQLRNTLHLEKDVSIHSGSLTQSLLISLSKDRVTLAENFYAAAAGTRAGKPVQIQPITINASATALPNGSDLPDIRDLKLAMVSAFANATGGGESLAKLGVTGNFDLTRLSSEVGQFHDLTGQTLSGSGTFAVNTAGDLTQGAAPISASADISNLTFAHDNTAVLTNETIHAGVSGNVALNQPGTKVSIDQLSATSGSGLFNIAKAGSGPFTLELNGPAMKGSGTITVAADVKRVTDLATSLGYLKLSADQPKLTAGKLDGTLAISQADQTKLSFDGALSGLNIGKADQPILSNESLKLSASVIAPTDSASKQPMMLAANIDSAFVKASVSDAKLDLVQVEQPISRLQSATVAVNVPDATKLAALINAIDPVMGTLAVTSGSADIALSIKRSDAATSAIDLSKCQIAHLGLARGKRTYSFDQNSVDLSLSANMKTSADKIETIQINKLSGDLRVASLAMPKPITVTDPLGAASADGAIELTGSIDALVPLLSVLQDADALPYRGDYKLTETIASKSGVTSLDGGAEINKLVVLDAATKKPAFTEDQVSLKNSLDLDAAKHNATVKSLTLDMPKSNAVGVKFAGQVRDWSGACAIAGVGSPEAQLDLTYDADKVWQLARPMLSPEMQTQYKDLKVAGKYTKTFKVSGSYNNKPNLSSTQRLGNLKSSGSLALDLLDLPQGLTLKAFDLPFTLEKGVLRTQGGAESDLRKLTAGADGKARIAKTAICNDGALNLDGMAIELNYADPLLSIEKKHVLLNDVALNSVLADTIGNGNLIFKDASNAAGLLDVTVVDCKRVPLGDLITTKQNAAAQIVFSVQKLALDSAPIQLISRGLKLGDNGIVGSINNGTLTLSQGRVDSNFAINIDQTRQVRRSAEEGGGKSSVTNQLPLEFGGGVVLASGALKDFVVNIPVGLIPAKSFGGTDLAKLLPNGLVVPFKGTTAKPSLDIGEAITRSVGDSLLGGKGDPADALKSLGDLLGKKKRRE